jgi:hypothetical protein
MGSEEPTVRTTAEEEIQAPLTSNQSMKPTAPGEAISICLPQHPAVAYLYLVRRKCVKSLLLRASEANRF